MPHFELQNSGNKISSVHYNSRAKATLGASATFQGVGEDVHGYGRIGPVRLDYRLGDFGLVVGPARVGLGARR